MLNKEYINFLALLLLKYKSKHLWVIFISSLLVAILSSFLFVTSSIKKDINLTLDAQADFVVQKYKAGKGKYFLIVLLSDKPKYKGKIEIVKSESNNKSYFLSASPVTRILKLFYNNIHTKVYC